MGRLVDDDEIRGPRAVIVELLPRGDTHARREKHVDVPPVKPLHDARRRGDFGDPSGREFHTFPERPDGGLAGGDPLLPLRWGVGSRGGDAPFRGDPNGGVDPAAALFTLSSNAFLDGRVAIFPLVCDLFEADGQYPGRFLLQLGLFHAGRILPDAICRLVRGR